MKLIKLQHRVPFWKRWFYNLSARCDLDYLREKKFTDVLTSDEVIDILHHLRPYYHYLYDDLSKMCGSNRTVFLHHLAMRMTEYRCEEPPAFDLAMIENECIGLSRTLFYVKTRFPRTPVHQILLAYVNCKAMIYHSGCKPVMFTTRAEVRDAFRKAYLFVQTDSSKYITTTLPSYKDLSVPGWADTYADVKRCMKGYIEGDDTYTKACERTRRCGEDIQIPYERERAFYQAVLDGKFDNVWNCLRFYQTCAAGLLLSHEMGVLPFELDEIVLWYLESEVQHDAELVWRLESVDRVCKGKYSCCLSELPYSLEYRLRAGQGTAPLCVRLMKGWRLADRNLHEIDHLTFDDSHVSNFRLECEVLETGVRLSVFEIPHQKLVYTAITEKGWTEHDYRDVWMDKETLCNVSKWYRIGDENDLEELGVYLCEVLILAPNTPYYAAMREWEGLHV